MITAELYAGPEDGRIVTVPGPAPSELRIPDSHGVRCLAMPTFAVPTEVVRAKAIPAHIYRWGGSRGQRAVYRYERTE